MARSIGICIDCGYEKPIVSGGRCHTCNMRQTRQAQREEDPDYRAKKARYRDAQRLKDDLRRKASTCWAILRALHKAPPTFNVDVRSQIEKLIMPYVQEITNELEDVRAEYDYNPAEPATVEGNHTVIDVHSELVETTEFTREPEDSDPE